MVGRVVSAACWGAAEVDRAEDGMGWEGGDDCDKDSGDAADMSCTLTMQRLAEVNCIVNEQPLIAVPTSHRSPARFGTWLLPSPGRSDMHLLNSLPDSSWRSPAPCPRPSPTPSAGAHSTASSALPMHPRGRTFPPTRVSGTPPASVCATRSFPTLRSVDVVKQRCGGECKSAASPLTSPHAPPCAPVRAPPLRPWQRPPRTLQINRAFVGVPRPPRQTWRRGPRSALVSGQCVRGV